MKHEDGNADKGRWSSAPHRAACRNTRLPVPNRHSLSIKNGRNLLQTKDDVLV
jgi:hypothetical protein